MTNKGNQESQLWRKGNEFFQVQQILDPNLRYSVQDSYKSIINFIYLFHLVWIWVSLESNIFIVH